MWHLSGGPRGSGVFRYAKPMLDLGLASVYPIHKNVDGCGDPSLNEVVPRLRIVGEYNRV